MVPRLAKRELLRLLTVNIDTFDTAYQGHWRPLVQPALELRDRSRFTAGKYLDTAIWQIDGMSGNLQWLCNVAGTRAKKHTLHATAHPTLTARHLLVDRPGNQGGSLSELSVVASAASALLLACNASRRACAYARSVSFLCALSRYASAARRSSAADCSAPASFAAAIACRASLISWTGGEVPQPSAMSSVAISRPRADAPKNFPVVVMPVVLRTPER